jgi:hypothetical protein
MTWEFWWWVLWGKSPAQVPSLEVQAALCSYLSLILHPDSMQTLRRVSENIPTQLSHARLQLQDWLSVSYEA